MDLIEEQLSCNKTIAVFRVGESPTDLDGPSRPNPSGLLRHGLRATTPGFPCRMTTLGARIRRQGWLGLVKLLAPMKV